MPTVNPVLAGNALTAGLRADFADTYKVTYEGVKNRLSDVMDIDIPTNLRTTPFAYFESAAYPVRWPMGDTISSKPFRSVQFSVSVFDWARRIQWHVNDKDDDQTRSLLTQARSLGQHFATLYERVFFQILRNATDSELLPAIPNAPDGAALFATTANGADRFGVSGGNIVTGGGVATSGAVRADFFNAIERFRQFQDTESQPLWDDSAIDRGFKVFYGVANWQVFAEAFQQGRTLAIVQNVAAAENVAAAAPTNVILDAGINVELVPTQRITDNDWFVCMKGAHIKPIGSLMRQQPFESFATFSTSDHTNDTGEEYMQIKSRQGFFVNNAFGALQVNN